jgi:hypothetical protein
LGKNFQIQLALKFSVNSVNALNQMPLACSIKTPFNATELSCAPVSTCASRAHEKEIQIHIQSIAIRNRAIAADNRATRIYIRATAADSRGIGIYSQEIASYIREIAADIQEMAVNIEEIAGYARRNAAAAVGRLPAADSQSF